VGFVGNAKELNEDVPLYALRLRHAHVLYVLYVHRGCLRLFFGFSAIDAAHVVYAYCLTSRGKQDDASTASVSEGKLLSKG